MPADLHAHSTASDGTATPSEVVALAQFAGLDLIALTDHDTTAGCPEARSAAAAAGIAFLDGVELSAEGAPGRCHILGLGIRGDDPELRETLAALSQRRRTRNERMIERLNALGVAIDLETVVAHAPPGANVGRPHFAAAMVALKLVPDADTAFRRFLGDGASAFVQRESLTPAEAIDLIHRAGGLAFLAHPWLVRLPQHETLEARVRALQTAGMDGIEVWYSGHTPAQEAKLERLAAATGLLATGGSDFHGTAKPAIRLGAVRTGRKLDTSLIPPQLRERAFR
ncbi:MAG: PHP domain-containing protein [Armatimonadota bacterium]